ncbi:MULTISPECIES: IS5 family transposase [Emticicia]|uniref:IS5 family transposase n=1 Tax=Emticicia TaxID=312278 RepID=UPI0007D8A0EF|nr:MULTISPECIES: IS5 family transposase [Emticicia]
MSILSKDRVKKYILPYLSQGKRGRNLTEDKRVSIVLSIFHRLKTGCQWRELPLEKYFKENYSYESVFYHFNKWSKDGSWERMWACLLNKYKTYLNLSNIQLDGSQTRANRGGNKVGFQFRKADETTNFLYLSDSQGILIAISEPISGQHHDLADIKQQFSQMINWLNKANIRTDGLFLNADAGFDSQECRCICTQFQIEANIAFNTRNGSINDRKEYFDELLYENRYVIERAFAWLDAFKALLIRYETTAINWLNLNIIGMIVCFVRKISSKLKC